MPWSCLDGIIYEPWLVVYGGCDSEEGPMTLALAPQSIYPRFTAHCLGCLPFGDVEAPILLRRDARYLRVILRGKHGGEGRHGEGKPRPEEVQPSFTPSKIL